MSPLSSGSYPQGSSRHRSSDHIESRCASTLAAGLAGINALSNLIGGGLMVNVVGYLKESTGSYVIGMIPLAVLCVAAAISVVILGRRATKSAEVEAVKA